MEFYFCERKRIIPATKLNLFLLVLLERTHEGSLLLVGLEPAVPELGGGVNELQAHVLKSPLLSVGEQRFPESKNPFLGANTASLQHKEILLHLTIVRETAHGIYGFVRQIVLCARVVFHKLKRSE